MGNTSTSNNGSQQTCWLSIIMTAAAIAVIVLVMNKGAVEWALSCW